MFKSQIALPSGYGMRDLNFHNGTLFGWAAGVLQIAPNGVLTSPYFAGYASFVFDAAGNVYSETAQRSIEKFDPAGNRVNTWSLPKFPYEIDLAGDQCTIFYLSYTATETAIDRYNVCTSQPLAPLITGLPQLGLVGNLRILPNNDVLLGAVSGVLRIAPNGQIIRKYSGTTQIALDPDRRSFWASGGGAGDRASKIDLATGDIIGSTTPDLSGLLVDSLTVVGEPRAAVSAAESIPTLSVWLLAALAATVCATGVYRLYR